MLRRVYWPAAVLAAALLVCLWPASVRAYSPAEPSAPQPIIFIDPGHGGSDSGAVYHGATFTLEEAEVNLDIALLTADRLRERGYTVYLSRETADQPGGSEDVNGDGQSTNRDGLQSVVDQANAVHADLFLSIHHNGSTNPSAAGSEVYYCADRPFADQSFRFGQLVLDEILSALARQGYDSPNRGVTDDALLYSRGPYHGHLFVLGPVRAPNPSFFARPTPTGGERRRFAPKLRATEMPGVLSEALFVSNPYEARLLTQPRIRAALADAFANAVDRYFAS
ncbi:MAG: N-acetylmuramoyl-L-alanine amidase [Anaerolineae bacterium]